MKSSVRCLVAGSFVLLAATAMAGGTPAAKCEAAKNKAGGAYYACRLKADATAVTKGLPADYGKCLSKFDEKWDGAESAGAGECPDNVAMTSQMEAYVSQAANSAAGIVAGSGVPSCGDGFINQAGEHCDGAALDGQTCAAFGLYGTLGCTAGCDLDMSGCTACPAGTLFYKDACWVLGAEGASCDGACTTLGLVYDSATASVAGSAGTDANCLALLYALGTPGGELDNAGGDCAGYALGCAIVEEFGFRARCGTPATTSAAEDPADRRVCACQ